MASAIAIEAIEPITMPDKFVKFVWQLVTDLHVFKTSRKSSEGPIMSSTDIDLEVADHTSSPSSGVSE